MSDQLNADWPRHWTGATHGLCGLVRFGDRAYVWMGNPGRTGDKMHQKSVKVTATSTEYAFEADGNELTVTFLSPVFADDLDMVSRPVTYVTVKTNREATVYFDMPGEVAVDRPNQEVAGASFRLAGLHGAWIKKSSQMPLNRSGDDLRIEWGTAYLVTARGESRIALSDESRRIFAESGMLTVADCLDFPRRADSGWPAAVAVSSGTTHEFLLAYDEEWAFEFLGRKLRPLWREFHSGVTQLLQTAWDERVAIVDRARQFDAEVHSESVKAGSEDLAIITTLAYRQAIAAHGFARDINGMLLMLCKENFSNGCIGTVDVTYPSAPLFLWKNPELVRAMIEPIMFYAASKRWKFSFAPHDLGQYPLANGQVYGGGELTEENQMPVEECGNLLILVAAYEAWSGKRDLFDNYRSTLKKWADYLLDLGLDPENQLCTDDFAGHLAHNANLSVKAILGLAAYGHLAARRQDAMAAEIAQKTRTMANAWRQMAEDGGHTRLSFDRAGSWSQKYNLVWDRLLNLNLFDTVVVEREVQSYLARQNEFGLPLDNRADYTKLDWIIWTATVGVDSPAKVARLGAFLKPIVHFLNVSPSRVPMTDWYDTKTGRMVGFQARSVVGGVFIPILQSKSLAL